MSEATHKNVEVVSTKGDHDAGRLSNEKNLSNVDSFHHDEAAQIVAEYVAAGGSEEWSELEEKNLVRKIDRRLLPVLAFTYMLMWYDKGILAQAAIFGLREDLKLQVGNRYSFASSIFYIGYLIGCWPLTMLAQRFPVARVVAALVTIWGICVILTAVCFNYRGLYVQRFFLGFLESAVAPIFMLICGGWYKKVEQPMRVGVFSAFVGPAAIMSILINYGFGKIQGSLAPWKTMFLFAGAVTILWGLLIFFILPADPISAGGLTARERYIAVARIRSNNAGVRNTHIKLDQIKEALTDLKFWLCFFFTVCVLIANGPASSFVPIIIKGFGFGVFETMLLSIPVGVIITLETLAISWVALKRPMWRCWISIACQFVAIMAALLLWLLPLSERGGLLFGIFIIAFGIPPYILMTNTHVANTAGYTKRATSSAGIYVAYCVGNIIGPLVFLEHEAPRYRTGFIVLFSSTIAAVLLLLAYRYVCLSQNRKRDRDGFAESFEHAYEDDLTDKKNPHFRYMV
ncbi:allantoate permease [Diaporthe helianthi]|uniref:Allantoate permease n=1 Tax=Diaporthe helianthi TaxID=158607 RepID=A0A2P5IEU0_DIAHE|nr:allantoate permease [Diaporthe helianthi]